VPAACFPVRHSILDEDALVERVLSRYALDGPLHCQFYRRSMSDAYAVTAGKESFFFKVYLYGRHSREEVEAEIAFANDLLSDRIPVAAPVADRCSEYIVGLDAPEGVRYGVLFRAAAGDEPQETNLAHSAAFGRLAARIHACADRQDKVYQRWHLDETYLIRDPIRGMRPFLQHRPADLDYLARFGEDMIGELCALLPRRPPEYGVCHGDLHAGNARLDRDGRLTLFDLDSFGYGWRALDIGVYRVSYDWLALDRETKARKDSFWGAFLDGYAEIRTLSGNELAAVALALPIRHLELMGLTMRYWAQHQGVHWIDDAYFDQHVAWFKRWASEYRCY
jgi:Ser/Thr protein kinase RdoA (MazF antagonist)